MKNGRGDVNITRVMDDVMKRDKTEYYSHEIAEVLNGENRNDRILVILSRIGK